MAKLSKTSAQTRNPRNDVYDVSGSQAELEGSDDESEAGTSSKDSPSNQLFTESSMGSAVSKEDVTDEALIAATQLLKSPFSAKSVRFNDEVAEESASILSKARSASNKLSAAAALAKQDPTKSFQTSASKTSAEPAGRSLRSLRATETGAHKQPRSPRKRAAPPINIGEEQPRTPSKGDGDARRSSRRRTGVATYNDNATTRIAAGLTVPADLGLDDGQGSPATSRGILKPHKEMITSPSGSVWTAEDARRLKAMREAGNSWDAIQVNFPNRTLSALQSYCSTHGWKVPGVSVNATPSKKRKSQNNVPSPSTKRQKAPASLHRQPNSTEQDRNSEAADDVEMEQPEQMSAEEEPTRRTKKHVRKKSKRLKNAIQKGLSNGIFNDPNDSNRGAKNGLEEDSDGADEGVSPDDSLFLPEQDEDSRLNGQLLALHKVADAALDIRESVEDNLYEPDYREKKQLPLIRKSFLLTNALRRAYKSIAIASIENKATDEAQDVIDRGLRSLETLVRSLDPDNEDEKVRMKCVKQIYAFVFIDLVRILCAAAGCYDTILGTQGMPYSLLNLVELDELIRIVRCIVTLRDRAQKWKTKPDSNLNLVNPIRRKIVAPLRLVLKEFEKQKSNLKVQTAESEASQKRREEGLHQQGINERRREEQERDRAVHWRLRALYTARQCAEWDPRLKNSTKFHMPKYVCSGNRQTAPPELDANGDAIERVSVFTQRQPGSHLPGGQSGTETWTEKQMFAIGDALQTCRGDHMWERVFKKYCGRDGPLEDLTVYQILTLAAEFQDASLNPVEDGPVMTDEWLYDIPDLDLLEVF